MEEEDIMTAEFKAMVWAHPLLSLYSHCAEDKNRHDDRQEEEERALVKKWHLQIASYNTNC